MPLYHLLILDRSHCRLDANLSGMKDIRLFFELRHKKNGYLIALYGTHTDGPMFPILPKGSRILAELVTARKQSVNEYIHSSAFSRFVTSRTILGEMQRVLIEYFD
jgi:hypothetical protein